jgi:aminotransferase
MRKQVRNGIAKREWQLPKTEFTKIMEIAEEAKDVISLGPGEPDFITPKHIINFAKKKLDQGYTHYSSPDGRNELKELIAKKLKKENRIDTSPERIIVTAGSQEALFLALMVLVDPTEKVLVPDPGFLAYKPMVEVLNGVAVSLPLYENEGFQINPERVKELIEPGKTKVLIVNSPSNPTGTVLKKKILEEIAEIAIENGLIVFSDEAYEKFVYDKAKHISIGSLNGIENYVVTFQSFSKTYAMPGFRVGYAAGPPDIINAMIRCHLYTSVCASTISQLAAMRALSGPQDSIEKMRREYDRRRKMLIKRLNEIPKISCLKPEGAFYAFPNITELKMNSLQVSHLFLKKAKVLVVPGTEFGKYGEGYIRLSYATSYEKIEEALNRIEKVVNSKV